MASLAWDWYALNNRKSNVFNGKNPVSLKIKTEQKKNG
jgi:hypothetical protein